MREFKCIVFLPVLACETGPDCDFAEVDGAITMNDVMQSDVWIEASHTEFGTVETTTDEWGVWSLELEPGTWQILTDHVCWTDSYPDEGVSIAVDCDGTDLHFEISYCLQ